MKPILKWAGGKRSVLNDLLKNIPEKFNKYYEPFLGSGTVFFALEPKDAVIGDLNLELINFYNILAYNSDHLIFYLGLYKNDKDFYYKVRNLDTIPYYKIMDKADKAARFIYLNKTGYNGLYRVNKKGHFNVPYGNYKNPNYNDKEVINKLSNFLKSNNISIRKGDYKETTKDISKNDFIYLDPPYFNSYNQYNSDIFGDDKHLELKNYIDYLTEKKVNVMLSNSNEEYIKNLYSDYNIKILKVSRNINPRSKNKKGSELLITNY